MNAYIRPGLIRDVEQAVSLVYELPVERIKARTRKREVVEARQISMWWRERNTRDTLSRIGELLGGYDHATVLHAVKTVNNLIDTDKHFKHRVMRISNIMSELPENRVSYRPKKR